VQPDVPHAETTAGLTEPRPVSGRDFHNQVGLMLKIADTGRPVAVEHHGKTRAWLSGRNDPPLSVAPANGLAIPA